MKHNVYTPSKGQLPPTARRVTHPRLGVRCWMIEGKYYRTRRDFLNPVWVKNEDGTSHVVDMSLPA